jgi:hypothetical protein
VAVGLILPQYAGSGGGRAQLVAFRKGWYSCLERRADALFELTDALLCADGPVTSFPHLSLEPEFRRGWGSGYAALAKGRVEMEVVRDLLVAHRPPDWPLVFAVDASTMERCDAETSPECGFYYHASKHSAGQPIVAGWSYQWITQLNWAKDSWTAPMDARRLHPCEDSVRATVAQVRELVRRLGDSGPVPLFVFDAGYDPIALGHELRHDRAAVLVRIKGDRVFYGDHLSARPTRSAARAGTASASTASRWRTGPPPTSSWSVLTASMARSSCRPGRACTPS